MRWLLLLAPASLLACAATASGGATTGDLATTGASDGGTGGATATPPAGGAGGAGRTTASLGGAGGTASSAGGAGGAACALLRPYSSKNAVCNACAEAKCCAEINACLGDPGCDDGYVNCALACSLAPEPDAGVDACLADCKAQYPNGAVEYDAATGCADAKCAAECQ